ncbi:MAG: SCO family protein [Steroidobacteraceae bacterium]
MSVATVRRRACAVLCDNPLVVARRLLVIVVPLLIVAVTAGALLARYLNPLSPQPTLTSGTWLPAGRDLAPAELVDQDGKPFTLQQLRGAPHLLFFGFTHCPDVCPTTLALLAQLKRGNVLPDLRIVFVSVDPQRDAPSSLKGYVDAFGADITGLTGTQAELDKLMRSVGAIAMRRDLPVGDYSMDHSTTVYLLDSQARIAAVFTPPLTLPALNSDLRVAAESLKGRL